MIQNNTGQNQRDTEAVTFQRGGSTLLSLPTPEEGCCLPLDVPSASRVTSDPKKSSGTGKRRSPCPARTLCRGPLVQGTGCQGDRFVLGAPRSPCVDCRQGKKEAWGVRHPLSPLLHAQLSPGDCSSREKGPLSQPPLEGEQRFGSAIPLTPSFLGLCDHGMRLGKAVNTFSYFLRYVDNIYLD